MKQANWMRALRMALILPLCAWCASQAATAAVEVDEALLQQMRMGEASGYAIFFRERPDLSPAYTMDWKARGDFVVEALQRTAARSQAAVREHLGRSNVQYQSFWIDNVIWVQGSSRSVFEGLMAFEEIAALRADPDMRLIEPDEVAGAGRGGGIEPNISHVNAPEVWSLGYEGQGLVIGNIDTGARYTHQALVNQYRGNLESGGFDHNHNWWDPSGVAAEPMDANGHGSHTVGTSVGGVGDGNRIGVAPGAQWMACRGCPGSGCPGDALLECAQFMLAPWDANQENPDPDLRPHVVNNSWGDCGRSYDAYFQGAIDAWHAAGIMPVFANGNASNCGYLSPPGCNTVGNPARYANVLSVGSTGTSNGQYAFHSNWGPTDSPWHDNPLGFPGVKPNVSAPGVQIRSAGHTGDGDYGLASGTSMSSPHVAGMVALLWQAAPCLVGDHAATAEVLMSTADEIPYPSQCGGEGPNEVPNHATGWGEIDALLAVNKGLALCGMQTIEGQVTRVDTDAVLEGVQIEVKGPMPRTVLTAADGRYEVGVMSGWYEVTASKPGFVTHTVSDVFLPEKGSVTVDHVLDLAPIAEIRPAAGLWLQAVLGEVASAVLELENTGLADLDWHIDSDMPDSAFATSGDGQTVDEVIELGGFKLDAPANGGVPEVLSVPAGTSSRGRVTGFSFSGTVSGIAATASWASHVCLIIQAPDGSSFSVGGFNGTQPGCGVTDWDFHGAGSNGDNDYSSSHAGSFNPAIGDLGEWTFTFVNDWNSTSAATMVWSDVTIVLHKTPLPICEGVSEVPWLSVDPVAGSTPPEGSDAVQVTVDTSDLSLGTFESALCISTNDGGAPLIPVPVTLTVTAAPPGTLEASPETVDFGSVPVGGSQVAAVTVTNSAIPGPTMLSLSGASVAVGSAFQIAGGTCDPNGGVLSAGESCTMDVRFGPDALGSAIGALLIEAGNSAPVVLTLSGSGIKPPDGVFIDRFEE